MYKVNALINLGISPVIFAGSYPLDEDKTVRHKFWKIPLWGLKNLGMQTLLLLLVRFEKFVSKSLSIWAYSDNGKHEGFASLKSGFDSQWVHKIL